MRGAEPLAAAARFHTKILPQIEAALVDGESIVVRFDHAEGKPHRWRNEAIAALARKYAPLRINAVAPAGTEPDETAIAATISFLAGNEGITGQLLIAG
ncbi:hypothetical protein EKN06_05185 [Croceicoccus ponticola]|uniref:Short chain dehydrogenase-like proteobacteria domain-containing protein n=2 Tax=Croceicoccus ponticola TaxID=2217664 RepID=A0A437H2E0_9SPHN|nr:hypothetical protein EKN06_05185 [Croceicoccus ponticola]